METDHDQQNAQSQKLFRRVKLRVSDSQRNAIYESVLGSSQIDIEYVALLALAGLIALFGLLENSAAVIIGAMLISPLMNPILSAALALLLGDGKLGKQAAIVLACSVAGVIGITSFVAFLTPLKQVTPEILARTAPNLLDLFIAFLSGLAGTLALRGGSVAMTILPGVAIAVAVVPPLSVVGYGLSTRQGAIAGGAFLLFITNLVSIVISAAAVFRVIGFQPQREAEQGRWKLKYRMGISALVLLLLSIPLFLTLRKAAIEIATRSQVQRELKTDFMANKASVSDLNFSPLQDGLLIQATLRTTHYVETSSILSAEEALRKKFGSGTRLMIDQILVTQGGVSAPRPPQTQSPILGGVVKPVEEKAPFNLKASGQKSLELVKSDINAVLAGTAIRQTAGPEMDLASAGPLVLKVQLASSEPLTLQTISLLASQLQPRLGVSVQLHGHVELEDPSLQMILAPPSTRRGLSPADRTAVNKLLKQVAQESDLRLQATCTEAPGKSNTRETPLFIAEFHSLLSRSRLQPSQWTIQTAPSSKSSPQPASENAADAVAPPSTATTKSAVALPAESRCAVQVFQDF